MKVNLAFFLMSIFFMTGCASIVSGTTDHVTINSSPTGAEFLIKDEAGISVHHGTTPATVTLERGSGFFNGQRYDVNFSAPNHASQTYPLDTSLNGWYFGNVVFGLFGVLGFLAIDPATGAMWSLPEHVNVSLSPMKTQRNFPSANSPNDQQSISN